MQTARACARPAGRGDHNRADMDTAPPHMAAQPQRRRQRPGGAADRTHTATEPPGAPFPSHSEPNGSFAAPPSTPHRPEASVEQHRTTIRRPRGLWRRMGDDRSHEMRAAGASDPSARAAAAASGPAGGRTQSRTGAAEPLAAPLDPTRRMAPAAPPLHGCRMHVPSAFPPAPRARPPRTAPPDQAPHCRAAALPKRGTASRSGPTRRPILRVSALCHIWHRFSTRLRHLAPILRVSDLCHIWYRFSTRLRHLAPILRVSALCHIWHRFSTRLRRSRDPA